MGEKQRTTRVIRITLLLVACLLFAACGQKGPLYLPDTSQEPQQDR